MMTRALGVCCILLAGLLLSACDGSNFRADPSKNSTRILGRRVWVTVTTDGGRHLEVRRSVRIERGETAASVLAQVADVRYSPEGALAQVNGMGGGTAGPFGPRQEAWFYRVDGIEGTSVRPNKFLVKPGQSIWWDLRRYDMYDTLPVAVGEFPQPLFTGWRSSGRPLRIAYGSKFRDDAQYFRDKIFQKIEPDVVSIDGSDNGGGVGGIGGEDTGDTNGPSGIVAVRLKRANLVIARWEEVLTDPNLADINFANRDFGITAWIEGSGTEIWRQDPDVEFPRRVPDAVGLVWASTTDSQADGPLVFMVTGTTDRGVHAAAQALASGSCQFYLTCLVDKDGGVIN